MRALGLVLMVLVGATAAEATQAVGALLLLGLLAAPAGAALRLTDRPFVALALSCGIAVVSMVVGLTLSHTVPALPPSFSVIAVATAALALTFVPGRLRRRSPHDTASPTAPPAHLSSPV